MTEHDAKSSAQWCANRFHTTYIAYPITQTSKHWKSQILDARVAKLSATQQAGIVEFKPQPECEQQTPLLERELLEQSPNSERPYEWNWRNQEPSLNSTIFTLTEFQRRHSITLPRHQHWWVVIKQAPGEVHALSNLRGIPRATNGIDLYIERGDGEVIMVHREWFVYDKNVGGGGVPKNDETNMKTKTNELEESLGITGEDKLSAQAKSILSRLGITLKDGETSEEPLMVATT